MRVLWLCNMPLPEAAAAMGISNGTGGGWLSAEFDQLRREDNMELAACFPLRHRKKIQKVTVNGSAHYAVPRKVHSFFRYDASMEPFFRQIVEEVRPDIIHIHGTENTPAWALMKACPEQTYVVSLQGIISMIAVHNHGALPYKWQRSRTLMDYIAKSSPLARAKMYRLGGQYEQKVIARADYLMGRTDWDRLCAEELGAKGSYVYAPEILREPFYHTAWSPENCTPHRIFSSAASTSIKGAHFLLEAVAQLKGKYPDFTVCFAGHAPCSGSLKRRLRCTGYEKYIRYLINKLDLKENVRFLGSLSAEKMADEMTKAHVYVHPSAIDNSPNALAEAMMVGTPCVASYVGGIPSMMENETEGLLYQYDAPYWLAHQISRIFDDKELAKRLSANARCRAAADHDKKNAQITKELYEIIMQKKTV